MQLWHIPLNTYRADIWTWARDDLIFLGLEYHASIEHQRSSIRDRASEIEHLRSSIRDWASTVVTLLDTWTRYRTKPDELTHSPFESTNLQSNVLQLWLKCRSRLTCLFWWGIFFFAFSIFLTPSKTRWFGPMLCSVDPVNCSSFVGYFIFYWYFLLTQNNNNNWYWLAVFKLYCFATQSS